MNKNLKTIDTLRERERESNTLKKEKERAITLIALVITIVILIILAGVLINISLGNNGLFNKAKTAKEMYTNAQEYEEAQIAKYSNEIDSYVGGNRNYYIEDELWNGLANEIKTYNFLDNSKKTSNYNYILILFSDKNGSDNQSMLLHKSQITLSSSTNLIQLTGYDTRYTTLYFNESSFTINYTDGTYICINKIIGIK